MTLTRAQVVTAIATVFKHAYRDGLKTSRRLAEEAVHEGGSDWAPSVFTIYTEGGLPSADEGFEPWMRVSERLHRFGHFAEPHNNAVICVWPMGD